MVQHPEVTSNGLQCVINGAVNWLVFMVETMLKVCNYETMLHITVKCKSHEYTRMVIPNRNFFL